MQLSPDRNAKIRWQCRRGMLELDILLDRFVKNRLQSLTEDEVDLFEALLSQTDSDLFSWLINYQEPNEPKFLSIVACIRDEKDEKKLPF